MTTAVASQERPGKTGTREGKTGTRELSMRVALNEALHEEMERDPSVFVIGTDVGLYGGKEEISRGLFERFGKGRVIDTPISEALIAGAATGAAIDGMRPVAEVQNVDFITLALDAILNHAAIYHYSFGGQVTVPMVMRSTGGSSPTGAQHSKSMESWLCHIPGIKVIMPSTPADAKGLLKAAIRDANPVLFFEHKGIYDLVGPVPNGEHLVEIGKADVKREGRDITIVATSFMVHESLAAAELLSAEGVDVEVIDPRTLMPLDLDPILRSVAKTGRLLTVHESWTTGGYGGEVVSKVVEKGWSLLKAAPMRLGAADVPPPFSRPLERLAVPSAESIRKAVKAMLG